ncbi:LLM class flavin-dependent oxidoreductase [Ktedonosporobacter rubrisoli]|uniref:LLM class flavin-dependent oxidoreductase n=2 Tax=Ktedonosporobacter rubrisoli TaxID=2509675 RepID=A0A4P6K633_KTERU|nr:LLM class flavin-dependent oxidoreductase [Ktedonosporobacter rubrisoli]
MVHTAQTAEECGYETLWLADHLMPTTPHQLFNFECWTSTAALARDTKRIRLCQEGTCQGYRNPALLAKMASTVDVLSHGRLTLGIAAGEPESAFQAFGYETAEAPTRLQQLEEAVKIILAMWQEETVTFFGHHYQAHGAINEPKGVQKPHIPLLIAGDEARVTLKLVAEYANACLLGPVDFSTLEQKLTILKQHCATVGRDFASIWRVATVFCAIGETDELAIASFSTAWKDHLQATKGFMDMFAGTSPTFLALSQWFGAILAGDAAGAKSQGLIGSPETIRERLAIYEALGIQELRLIFPDAAHLLSIRHFAKEFIS